MSADTREFIDGILRGFRELVVSIEDENYDLKSKLRGLSTRAKTLSRTTRQTAPVQPIIQSTSSSLTTNTSDPTTTTTSTRSPIDEPSTATNHTTSSATLSSATAATTSTKPPPYKSVVRIAPLPPARTRRRNGYSTIDRSTTSASSIMGSSTGFARGALIVLEGLDRVGKSTLAKKLVEHFERTKKPVSYCRFPDRTTPIGRLIDEFLRSSSKKVDDRALHLLFSANRWELDTKIRKTILDGTTVIVDRYSYTGIAYSSAKSNLSLEWCRETERGLPKPDLVIYLELPKETQSKRAGFGDERFETIEFQECARRQYQQVMEMSQETWLRIDVENKSPDQILGEIIVPVRRCLDSCANKSLGSLDFL